MRDLFGLTASRLTDSFRCIFLRASYEWETIQMQSKETLMEKCIE